MMVYINECMIMINSNLKSAGGEKVRKIVAIVLIGAALFLGALSFQNLAKEKTADDVMSTVIDKYGVQGYIIGEDSATATIDVDVYKEEDIEKVEEYIRSNLSDEDLKHYDLKVFSGWDIN